MERQSKPLTLKININLILQANNIKKQEYKANHI